MEILFVTLVLTGMFIVLIKQWSTPDLALFVTMSIFLLTGIITVEEAFMGFASTSVITIALLFIIGYSVFKSGMLLRFLQQFLKSNDKISTLVIKIMAPVSLLSGIMNNTPIVAMLTPTLREWAEKHEIAASKLLIPLSYAAILGGSITLYGSSTNLVVHGMLIDHGDKGFSIFEFAFIGIPLTLLGILYMAGIGHHLLPSLVPPQRLTHAPSLKKVRSSRHTWIVLLVLTAMIFSVTFHFLSIVKAALAGVILLLVTKSIRASEAKEAVNWSVVILMASAMGIGKAMENSGLTELFTTAMMQIYPFIGLAGITFLLYLATMLLTEISHNIAAAVMMFPVGQTMAEQIEIEPKMFALVIAISASCSFITPIGYQTNMIVYDAGGYQFKDFSRVGFGLSLLCALCTVGLALLIWG
ncbi:SLC13 family permease [Halobacillus sp. B23F22_1]|uniref:SLC13 family permease n=1 Tax=Halobacillus sp. B23F22_1 TaxID=3459514 RepID=UPI00373F741F